jgi:hypothetical protein
MCLKRWYRNLLFAWAPVGPLVFILGWGFAGEAPWKGLSAMFEAENFDIIAVSLTLIAWTALLSPFLLLPLGLSTKSAR